MRSPILHAAAWALLIAAALLVTGPEMGPAAPWIRRFEAVGGDKAVHAVLFLVQAWLVARILPAPRSVRWLACAAGLALAYGGFTEGVQLIVPGRSAELSDLVADGIGAVLGAVVAGLAGRRS